MNFKNYFQECYKKFFRQKVADFFLLKFFDREKIFAKFSKKKFKSNFKSVAKKKFLTEKFLILKKSFRQKKIF